MRTNKVVQGVLAGVAALAMMGMAREVGATTIAATVIHVAKGDTNPSFPQALGFDSSAGNGGDSKVLPGTGIFTIDNPTSGDAYPVRVLGEIDRP